MYEELARINAAMQECARNGDVEACHAEADKLLLDLILALGQEANLQPAAATTVDAIIAAYSDVEKWYA